MSAKDDEFRDYCLELLSSLRQGDIAAKKMFGGVSFSIDGKTFSIIAFDELWLKVDDESRAAFEQAKCRIFTYDGKDGVRTMNYYTVPEEAMESAALMRPWAMLGWEAALRAAANKTKKNTKNAATKTTDKPAAKKPAAKRPAIKTATKTTAKLAKKPATTTKK
jgi:DNA transformation protein and related proteins